MLHWEERLFSHQHYCRAAVGAIHCYLRIHDDPGRYRKRTQEELDEEAMSQMDDGERKRFKLQRKREEDARRKREEEEEAAREKEAKERGKPNPEEKRKKDADPEGVQLTRVDRPLEEAARLLGVLRRHAPSRPEVQLAAFEVSIRRGKLLQAAAAVRAAGAVMGLQHPALPPLVVRLALAADKAPAPEGTQAAAMAAAALKGEVQALLGGKTPMQFSEQALAQQGSVDASGRAGAAEALLAAGAPRDKAAAAVTGPEMEALLRKCSHKEAVAVHRRLVESGVLGGAGDSERFLAMGRKVWSRSKYFGGERQTPAPVAANGVVGDLAKLTV